MVKNFNSSKSNTSGVDAGDGLDDIDTPDPVKNFNSSKSNTSGVDAGDGLDDIDTPDPAKNFNSSKSNTSKVGGGGGGTTGLKSTLGLIKSGFTLATIIVLIAAGADVYKMYDDHVTINLEDHITDANFRLTLDKNSIVGDIGFDIPKMGYFEKSIDTLIHLRILESDPTTENDFTFEYTLGSGEMIYDKFELNNLDPVTKDKIDKGEPLDIEYTITITIIYLGVELGPTTSEIGTKVTTIQTTSES